MKTLYLQKLFIFILNKYLFWEQYFHFRCCRTTESFEVNIFSFIIYCIFCHSQVSYQQLSQQLMSYTDICLTILIRCFVMNLSLRSCFCFFLIIFIAFLKLNLWLFSTCFNNLTVCKSCYFLVQVQLNILNL